MSTMRCRTSWLARLLHGRRLDRNPLRRGSDRAETIVIGALLGGFLAAGHSTRIWVDRASRLTGPPLSRDQLTGWDAEWLVNGPRWSPRR